ncbi:RNA-directed DNA polymerase, eukaryota, reverse transcriptase zinc-binding domain protein, partial [Tanacetum coccineum]
LHTRMNLDIRGMDLNSTRCPVCDDALETAQHLFIDCKIARNLWVMIQKWWLITPKDLQSLIFWSNSTSLPDSLKSCFDAIIQSTTWIIWRYRNRLCFDIHPPQKDNLGGEIKTLSYSWISHRKKDFHPNWNVWILDPINACNNTL